MASSQLMVTSTIVRRVYRIRYEAERGSAFSIEVNGRQYLVTAGHVVPGIGTGDTFYLWKDGSWQSHQTKVVGWSKKPDIAVLAIEQALRAEDPIGTMIQGLTLGQDVFFLGFPFDIIPDFAAELNDGYPLPLVKKGCLSMLSGPSTRGLFLVDAHNNPGFSGGPLVFYDSNRTLKVAGVVSGYRYEYRELVKKDKESPATLDVIDRENSGIMHVYAIDLALEMISGNPIGTILRP